MRSKNKFSCLTTHQEEDELEEEIGRPSDTSCSTHEADNGCSDFGDVVVGFFVVHLMAQLDREWHDEYFRNVVAGLFVFQLMALHEEEVLFGAVAEEVDQGDEDGQDNGFHLPSLVGGGDQEESATVEERGDEDEEDIEFHLPSLVGGGDQKESEGSMSPPKKRRSRGKGRQSCISRRRKTSKSTEVVADSQESLVSPGEDDADSPNRLDRKAVWRSSPQGKSSIAKSNKKYRLKNKGIKSQQLASSRYEATEKASLTRARYEANEGAETRARYEANEGAETRARYEANEGAETRARYEANEGAETRARYEANEGAETRARYEANEGAETRARYEANEGAETRARYEANEGAETRARYNASFGGKEARKRYNSSQECLESKRKYECSKGALETRKRYKSSEGRIESQSSYEDSWKGLQTRIRYNSSKEASEIRKRYISSQQGTSVRKRATQKYEKKEKARVRRIRYKQRKQYSKRVKNAIHHLITRAAETKPEAETKPATKTEQPHDSAADKSDEEPVKPEPGVENFHSNKDAMATIRSHKVGEFSFVNLIIATLGRGFNDDLVVTIIFKHVYYLCSNLEGEGVATQKTEKTEKNQSQI